MFNPSRTGKKPGDPSTDAGRARSDLDSDESNVFGPDALNTREGDAPGGQIAPEVPPPEPPATPLDHGDFAPDET